MPTNKGTKTNTLFLKSESHKLHEEFTVKTGQTVEAGAPVVLNTDGTVQKAGAAAKAKTIIGYALQNGAAEELITVACKGYGQIYGYAEAGAITAGPVKAMGTTLAANNVSYPGYANVNPDNSEDASIVGWSLDAGDDDDVVRILVTA